MEKARKQEIYDICVQYGGLIINCLDDIHTHIFHVDVIIVEDDPYYFLQQGEYVPKAQRDQRYVQGFKEKDFIKNLAPSYLAFVPLPFRT